MHHFTSLQKFFFYFNSFHFNYRHFINYVIDISKDIFAFFHYFVINIKNFAYK